MLEYSTPRESGDAADNAALEPQIALVWGAATEAMRSCELLCGCCDWLRGQ